MNDGRYWRLEPQAIIDTGATNDRYWRLKPRTTADTGSTSDRYWSHERQPRTTKPILLDPLEQKILEPQESDGHWSHRSNDKYWSHGARSNR